MDVKECSPIGNLTMIHNMLATHTCVHIHKVYLEDLQQSMAVRFSFPWIFRTASNYEWNRWPKWGEIGADEG